MKKVYIDLMEKVFDAYTIEHIKAYTESVKKDGIKEHGYPRLAANLGILIANGRKTELKDEFLRMMDLCCDEMPNALKKPEKVNIGVGNDFSVKEIVFCILEVEKSKIFEKEVTDRWREKFSKIEPLSTYDVIAKIPPEKIGNWAAFGAASEQLRKYAGIGDESAFIDNQIASQLFSFDENGMYRDPNEPIVYEFVTRLQLAVAVWFGYKDKNYDELMKYMMKSSDITLKMQSVTGEIPFGGRSNQFLHNESFYAALCEFYASIFKKQGDLKKAGMFKQAARIAIESIVPWLSEERISHIKNFYHWEEQYGCEGYAYFDKYMITTASWLYIAYIMADDDIEEVTCPVIGENYIIKTSEHFHKVFLKYNDYAVELDTKADYHYDASGIGRIHKKDVPSAICLSVPFTKTPNYKLDIENSMNLSVCGGIKKDDEFLYAADESFEYKLVEENETPEYVEVIFECKSGLGVSFVERCRVSDDGVEIEVEGDGEIKILFPVFKFDGKNSTDVNLSEQALEVIYMGHKCLFETDDKIIDENTELANRNGHYMAYSAYGKDKVNLKIKLI